MNKLLIYKIRKSGFKLSFLAEQTGVSKNTFYQCLKGNRNLSTEKEKYLEALLEKINLIFKETT